MLGHCRCRISHGAEGGSISPPLEYHIRLVSHTCCLFVFSSARPSWQLLCRDFSALFFICSPSFPQPLFWWYLQKDYTQSSWLASLFCSSALVCVDLFSSPLVSRLLWLIISQTLHRFLLLLSHSLRCTLFTWAGHKMTLLQCKCM